MTAIDIRPVVSNDFSALSKIAMIIETSHTWQMDTQLEEGQIQANFRRIRLPRSINLEYPRSITAINDSWKKRDLFLAARIDSQLCAFLSLDLEESQSGHVWDLVVDEPYRRQGVASSLLVAAQDWLKENGIYRMTVDISLKNEAAIALAEKLGFVFTGFMDGYFKNREIVLFFAVTFR